MKPSRVLVTGASGQLGSVVASTFADRAVIAHTRASLDITRADVVARTIADAAPDLIVNCAAFNDVDGAEDRPLEALAVNSFALRSLARTADASGAVLVHYSSDFVFDGQAATEPYSEEAAPFPRSIYAASKLLGEWFALEAPNAFVLRVESLFGMARGWTGRQGTLDGIVDSLEQGRVVRAFTDRIVSPSYVEDVARATKHLVDNGAEPGLYHCVNSGRGSWYRVSQEAARLLGVIPRLQPITTEELRLKAPRPRFCALDNRKLAATGFTMPAWEDALARWLAARGRPAA